MCGTGSRRKATEYGGGHRTFTGIAAEFVGTTIVMVGGPGLLVLGGADIGALGVALGFGVAIVISIGVISAVANPMFSLALWFSKAITTTEAVADWVGQLLGALTHNLIKNAKRARAEARARSRCGGTQLSDRDRRARRQLLLACRRRSPRW